MEPAKHGRTQQLSAPNKNGYVLIIMVLILASVFSVVLVKITIQSIVFLKTSTLRIAEANLSAIEKSCVNENLIQLTRNPDYAGETLSLFSGSCTSVVSTNGSNKNIAITFNQSNYNDSLLITFDPTQKKIVVWDN